uniref:DnaJ domain-containing protein n=1 Tax=Pasteurella multocida TaxID=747 RepID=UPI003F4ABCEB
MNINEALNLLNLSQNVSKDDIKKAYKKMAIKYHPDRNPAGAEVMKAINAAFEFLALLQIVGGDKLIIPFC